MVVEERLPFQCNFCHSERSEESCPPLTEVSTLLTEVDPGLNHNLPNKKFPTGGEKYLAGADKFTAKLTQPSRCRWESKS